MARPLSQTLHVVMLDISRLFWVLCSITFAFGLLWGQWITAAHFPVYESSTQVVLGTSIPGHIRSEKQRNAVTFVPTLSQSVVAIFSPEVASHIAIGQPAWILKQDRSQLVPAEITEIVFQDTVAEVTVLSKVDKNAHFTDDDRLQVDVVMGCTTLSSLFGWSMALPEPCVSL